MINFQFSFHFKKKKKFPFSLIYFRGKGYEKDTFLQEEEEEEEEDSGQWERMMSWGEPTLRLSRWIPVKLKKKDGGKVIQ
jgi:hypothetical protein